MWSEYAGKAWGGTDEKSRNIQGRFGTLKSERGEEAGWGIPRTIMKFSQHDPIYPLPVAYSRQTLSLRQKAGGND